MTGQEQPRQAAPAQAGGAGFALSLVIFGFGAAAGVLLAFSAAGFVEDSTGIILTVFLSALFIVGGLGLLVFVFRRPILRRLFGYAETQVELFADPLARVATGALARDPEAATAAARDLVSLGLARYSWLATRRWVITSLTALIAAMAALAGTALLFKQNALLEVQNALLSRQNDKIEAQSGLLRQQVELAEADRNAQLSVEMTAIASAIGIAAERAAAELAQGLSAAGQAQERLDAMVNVIDPMTQLDRGLMLRIVSVSRAVRPYRFLDNGLLPDDPGDRLRVAMTGRRDDLPNTWSRLAAANAWQDGSPESRLIDRPASPERGQLLNVLIAGGVRNLEVLNHFGLDLGFALLQNADLILVTALGARLAYADFSGAQIRSCDLGGASLANARFRRAVIADSDFSEVEADRVRTPYPPADAPYPSEMSGADFTDAVIRDTRFVGASLIAARFDRAVLAGADFSRATLGAATLRGAVILAADFSGTDLKSADLDGAIVFGEGFLDRLAESAAPGRFVADRFRADPVPLAEVMATRLVALQFTEAEVGALTGGAPAFRLTRIAPFAD